MNKRILSMLLALVMVVLAVPAFSLALTAEEPETSYRPTTSSLVTDGENWPTWTYHADEVGGHGKPGCYQFTPADETGVFGDTWSFGAYFNGAFVEYGRYYSDYGQLTYSAGVWDQGYVAVHDGGIAAGNKDMTELGFSYIAPYTGTVDLSFAIMMQQYAKFTFGIKVDGKLVYPAQDGGETWKATAAGDNAFEAKGIEVKAGQRISFLFKHNQAWDYLGKFKSASVTYTEVKSANGASYTVDAGANLAPDGEGNPGRLISGHAGIANTGILGWTSGEMKSSGFVEYKTIGSHGWLGTVNVESGLWGGNGGYNTGNQALTPTAGNMAVALQYTAEFDGAVEFGVSLFKFKEVKQNGATNYFTVYVNDKIVWPIGAQDFANGGYAVTVEDINATASMDVASAMSAAMDGVSVNVKKGDKISFAMYRPVEEVYEQNYMCVAYGPTVTYTAFNYGPAFASAQVALNEAFAIKLNVDEATLFEGATNIGAYVNGKFVAATNGTVTVSDIVAKELTKEITVQPACTLDGAELRGAESTVSVAELLTGYVTDDPTDKTSNLAIATLNYAAAAQTYFGTEGELANAALTDEQKALTYKNTYADGHKINIETGTDATAYGVKLILGDTVNIAVYFNSDKDLTNGYSAVCKNGEETYSVKFVKVENSETLYKAIFEGFMPTAWDADLEFSVTDGEKTVSETLTYSVTDYCARMQDYVENGVSVDPVVDAMLALYEAADAYTDTLK